MLDEMILQNTLKFHTFLEYENLRNFSFCAPLTFPIIIDLVGIHWEKIKQHKLKKKNT